MSVLPSRPHVRRFAALAAAALLLPLTLSACGDAADKIAEKAAEKAIENGASGDVDVDIDGDQVKIENSDGSFTSGQGLPDSFPEDDVPLVGEVQAGSTSSAKGSEGWTVTTRSEGSSDDAFTEAIKKLEGAGFKADGEAVGSYAGFRSDKFQVILTATDDQSGGAILSYIVGAAE